MTWLGVLPDAGTTSAIVRWAVAERGSAPVSDAWAGRPASVSVTSTVRPDGTRLWFVAQHGWDRVSVPAPAGAALVLAGTGDPVAGEVELGPWESVVFAERATG
jgi:hypothetical protein